MTRLKIAKKIVLPNFWSILKNVIFYDFLFCGFYFEEQRDS